MKSLKELLGFDMNYNYSTMIPKGIDQRVIYNSVECIWGLNEKGSPPTLIHPRPKITLQIEDEIYREDWDISMHRCIQNEKPEDIIKAMFNKKISFNYYDTKRP